MAAKSKSAHTIAIEYSRGSKSLLEVDDKKYKALVKMLF